MTEIKEEKFPEIELNDAERISMGFPAVTEIPSAPELLTYLPNHHTHTKCVFFERNLLLILPIVTVGLSDQNKSQVPIFFIKFSLQLTLLSLVELFRELLLIKYVSSLILVDAVTCKDS